jgi:hypothetical protein
MDDDADVEDLAPRDSGDGWLTELPGGLSWLHPGTLAVVGLIAIPFVIVLALLPVAWGETAAAAIAFTLMVIALVPVWWVMVIKIGKRFKRRR